MIIIYLGGIGSGKTLGCVKDIIDNNQYAVTNFKLNLPDKQFYRIKVSDIIKHEKIGKASKYGVNWGFWSDMLKAHPNYSIYLDEVHNIVHARRSMSHMNIQMSKWISQIRKILADKPKNHLFLISQTIRKIDVDFRELAQIVVKCSKVDTTKGRVLFRQDFYSSVDNYLCGIKRCTKIFNGKHYYPYYNYKELVTFEDVDEYL